MNVPAFRVVVPVRNAAEWIIPCLASIARQRTDVPVTVCVIDDASTDRTGQFTDYFRGPGFDVLHRADRAGALANIVGGLGWQAPHDDDVCVTVDGDDRLLGLDALAKIDTAYAPMPDGQPCLLTYGNFAQSNGERSWVKPYPEQVVHGRAFRACSFYATHLRTFRYGLWRRIRSADLLDPETGRPWDMAWDQAFMFPMLEMAGERHRCIEDVLYWYNMGNPQSDHVVNGPHQRACADRIAAMPKYDRVEWPA